MRGVVSSSVPKRDRVKRAARTDLADFTDSEVEVIEAARSFLPGPVAVFGSRARGDWADDSDIDLGLSGYAYTIHRPMVDRLNEVFDIKVDVTRFEYAKTHKGVVVV